MKIRNSGMRCVAAALMLSLASVRAGKLDGFERSATGSTRPANAKPGRPDPHDDDSFWAGVCAEILMAVFAYGGVASMQRVVGDEDGEFHPRRGGEALIPFARLDASYQVVESDVSALDALGEIGFACIAFQARRTSYREDDPGERLDTTQLHGLYRMSFGSHVEVDLGMGSLRISGDDVHSGFSLTTPVRVHPTDRFGVEYRPVWSSIDEQRIAEHDLAAFVGWRYASLRVGYRWFHSEGASLNGPEIGLSLRW